MIGREEQEMAQLTVDGAYPYPGQGPAAVFGIC